MTSSDYDIKVDIKQARILGFCPANRGVLRCVRPIDHPYGHIYIAESHPHEKGDE